MEQKHIGLFVYIRNKVRNLLHDDREFTIAEAHQWFKNLDPRNKYYMIDYGTSLIGYFRTVRLSNGVVQIGADLTPEYHGRGIAFKAYQEFMKRYNEKIPTTQWELEVLSTNTRAYNLYDKLGFKKVGFGEDVIRDGRKIPSIKMVLC